MSTQPCPTLTKTIIPHDAILLSHTSTQTSRLVDKRYALAGGA